MTQDEISRRIEKLKKDKAEFMLSIRPVNFKSMYITCEACGSKIRRDLFKGVNGLDCPACGHQFMSASSRARLESFNTRIKDAEKLLRAEQMKEARKLVRQQAQAATAKKNAVRMIDGPSDFVQFKYDRTIDTGYGVFSAPGIIIPLLAGAKRKNIFDENGYVKDDDFPIFDIQYEEERFGNDTWGWNAFYHPGYGNDCQMYVCGKEGKAGAIAHCERYFEDHKAEIMADFAKAMNAAVKGKIKN